MGNHSQGQHHGAPPYRGYSRKKRPRLFLKTYKAGVDFIEMVETTFQET